MIKIINFIVYVNIETIEPLLMTSFQQKTIFITGASRGIGLAMAKKLASLGANIVIAAKTSEPHPKLPGTIHSAAEEIEALGGQALALMADIREEAQVQAAVAQAVERFGGIDALINNASAIQLTGTLETDMKRFDLMSQVNARGTYLCSRACLPHLLQSDLAQVLTISPPLNMQPHWFKHHVAYTYAKYGMSIMTLGMAAEFSGRVAFNSLWPKTAIATAAIAFAVGDASMLSKCRKPEIMADAAALVLQGGKANSGQFLIDEEVLRAAGVEDFASYRMDPTASEADLVPDFFI